MTDTEEKPVSRPGHSARSRCAGRGSITPTVPWSRPTTSTRSWGWAQDSLQADRRGLLLLPLSPGETDFYPHYIHNLDNLIRFGGLYPPIHVHADIRRTRLLGATWVYEGGAILVRAGDPIFRMQDLKGKKIGLSKSLNTIKNDWWRIT